MKRIKHNDLTHYFMTPHEQLPASYLASCEKFFKKLSTKHQASSTKLQAPAGQPEVVEKKIWHPTFSMIQGNYVYTSFYAQRAFQNLQDREGIRWVCTGPQFTRRAKAPLAWFCIWLQSCGRQNQQDFGWEKILIFRTQARKRLAK